MEKYNFLKGGWEVVRKNIYTPEVILSIFSDNTNYITRTIELKNSIWFYIYERGGGEAGKAYKSGSVDLRGFGYVVMWFTSHLRETSTLNCNKNIFMLLKADVYILLRLSSASISLYKSPVGPLSRCWGTGWWSTGKTGSTNPSTTPKIQKKIFHSEKTEIEIFWKIAFQYLCTTHLWTNLYGRAYTDALI